MISFALTLYRTSGRCERSRKAATKYAYLAIDIIQWTALFVMTAICLVNLKRFLAQKHSSGSFLCWLPDGNSVSREWGYTVEDYCYLNYTFASNEPNITVTTFFRNPHQNYVLFSMFFSFVFACFLCLQGSFGELQNTLKTINGVTTKPWFRVICPFVELLHVFACIVSLTTIILSLFLSDDINWGWRFAKNMLGRLSSGQGSTVTFCDFHGMNIEYNGSPVQCALGVNESNKTLLMLNWFAFFFITAVVIMSYVYWFYISFPNFFYWAGRHHKMAKAIAATCALTEDGRTVLKIRIHLKDSGARTFLQKLNDKELDSSFSMTGHRVYYLEEVTESRNRPRRMFVRIDKSKIRPICNNEQSPV